MSKSQKFLRVLISGVLVFFGFLARAEAAETTWAATDHSRMRLITAVDSIGAGDSFEAALHMRMSEGWHSYWRVSGDAGAPPRFDWGKSENVEAVEVSWQAPERFDEFGFQTFGYSDDVYFLLDVKVKEPGKTTMLSVNVQTMVCSDICIPQTFNLSMRIPAGDGAPVTQQKLIDFEKRKVPVSGNSPALAIETVVAGPEALVVNAFAQDGFDKADVFAVGDDFALTAIPEILPDEDDVRRAMIKIPKPADADNLNYLLQGKELSITLVSGRKAVEQKITF